MRPAAKPWTGERIAGLATVLYEGITGKANVDLQGHCGRAFHEQKRLDAAPNPEPIDDAGNLH
jgi:hypothetical protein